MANRWGKSGSSDIFSFLCVCVCVCVCFKAVSKSLQTVTVAMKLKKKKKKMLAPWKESYDKSRQSIKKQRHHFANKGMYSQSYGLSSSHILMWELYHKGWALKNWCFQTVVMEKTLESPLDCKEIKLANPKRNQPWILIGRTDAEAEALILWPPDVKSQLIGKDLMLGKIECKRRRGRQRMRWLDSITDQ